MICYLNLEFNVLILCELMCFCEHCEGRIQEDSYCSVDGQQVCHTVHEETKRCLSHGGVGEYPGGGALHTTGICRIYCAGLGGEEGKRGRRQG